MASISIIPALFILGGPEKIDAYLDPGTGSIIIQVVIGVAVGGLFTVKIFWNRTDALTVDEKRANTARPTTYFSTISKHPLHKLEPRQDLSQEANPWGPNWTIS